MRKPAAIAALALLAFTPLAQAQSDGWSPPDPRHPIECKVKSFEPILNFDFRLVSNYVVTIPTRQLAGDGNEVLIFALARPLDFEDRQPEEFKKTVELGDVPENFKGKTELSSAFITGEGRYHIDWRLLDRYGRGCRLEWEIDASLGRKQRGVPLSMSPGEIVTNENYLFRDETPVVNPVLGKPLRVKFLANFDVPKRRGAPVQTWEYGALIAFLRAFVRHPRFAEFNLVGYSVEDQAAFYRQDSAKTIDFCALGDAIKSLSPATVELQQLRRGASTEFLDDLLVKELLQSAGYDAIVVFGFDSLIGRKISKQQLAELEALHLNLFHLRPNTSLWRGMAGRVIKSLDGETYRIGHPRDLAEAIEDIVQIAADRQEPPQPAGIR